MNLNLRLLSALAVCLLSLSVFPAGAQRFTVGVDAVDLATLGTVDVEASMSVARRLTVHAGAEFNPWTFYEGTPEKQFQSKSSSVWGSIRYWPWHVYSGWWYGAEGKAQLYNVGGVFSREKEEGTAYGVGVYAGYGVMLNAHFNLDVGVGAWGGYKWYRSYTCPQCGMKTDEGSKPFILPDAKVVLQYIF